MFGGLSLASIFKLPSQGRRQPARVSDDQEIESARQEVERRYKLDRGEENLIALIERRFSEAEQSKAIYYEKWAQSYAFYRNQHWLVWQGVNRQLDQNLNDGPSWRIRMTDNKITKTVLNIASRRSQAAHVTHGVPNNSQSSADVDTAQIVSRLLRHTEAVSDYEEKRLHALILSTIYGTAFYEPYWNPTKTASVGKIDPATGVHFNAGRAMVGDYDLDVCSVWEIFPQPMDRWDKVNWCIRAQVQSIDWMRQVYGDRALMVKPEQEVSMIANSGYQNPGTKASSTFGTLSDTARVKTYYEKPSKSHPRGRWAVVAGGVLLYSEDELPHPNLRFPIIPMYGIYDPESIWGMGWVELGVDQQRLMNRMLSWAVEDMNMLGRPKILVPRGCKVDRDQFHSGPGEIIPYNAEGGRPEPFIGATRSPFAEELFALANAELRDATGVTEVSLGQQEGSVTAASALLLLSKNNDLALNVAVKLEAATARELARYAIELVAQEYDVPRFIRVVGENQEQEVFTFMGADLMGNTEVDVRASDGVSDTPEFRRTSGMELIRMGVIKLNTPEDAADFLRILNEPELAALMERVGKRLEQLQAKQAEMEQQQHAQLLEQQAAMQEQQAAAQEQAAAMQAEQAAHQRMADQDREIAEVEAKAEELEAKGAELEETT